MFDKEAFFAALRGLKIGQGVAVPAAAASAARAYAPEFEDRYSVQLDCAATSEGGIFVRMRSISGGSPLHSRTVKPWHALAVGESKFVPEGEVKKVENLRAYVSIHGAKVNHNLSVSKVDGGYNVTRKAAP